VPSPIHPTYDSPSATANSPFFEMDSSSPGGIAIGVVSVESVRAM